MSPLPDRIKERGRPRAIHTRTAAATIVVGAWPFGSAANVRVAFQFDAIPVASAEARKGKKTGKRL